MKDGERWLQKYSPHFQGVVYDLGCGKRSYESFILNTASKYVGVDWSNSIHDLTADIVSNLNKPLAIKPAIADTVISLSVMEHLCEPEVMLRSAYSLLRPGGKIVLQVPFQWQVHEAPHDYFRFTPFGLRHLFEKAGFDNIEVTPTGGFFTTWIMKINYFTKRLIRGPAPIKLTIHGLLLIFWTINQILAPLLDNLDRHWILEAPGYWVTATKPGNELKH